MTSFFSALSFLSIFPVPKNGSFDRRMVIHFPLVGLLIGGLLIGVDWLGKFAFPPLLRCTIDVLFLAVVTGALHLDGLADSADGLCSHKPRSHAMEIMRDPRVGVIGVTAIVFCILLKIGSIRGIDSSSEYLGWIWLLLAPALARSSQVIGLVVMDDARKGEGIGSALYQKGNYPILIVCLIPLIVLFFFQLQIAVIAFVVFVSSTLLLLVYFHCKIGGMTGDTFGAMTELVETFILVAGAGKAHFAQLINSGSF